MTKAELQQAVAWLKQQADLGDDKLVAAIKVVSQIVLAEAIDDTIAALKHHGQVSGETMVEAAAHFDLTHFEGLLRMALDTKPGPNS